ncbi:MAG TPA: helix-turn-helix domain-containing protein [Candidatus Dormibacteraeota bacterium]|jgi:excisionase family DNA binding protein
MLTVPEVARRLNRDPETVRRWIRAGKLRAHRVGTQHIVEDEDLAALMKPSVSVPPGWMQTATGEPMPDILNALRASRLGR